MYIVVYLDADSFGFSVAGKDKDAGVKRRPHQRNGTCQGAPR